MQDRNAILDRYFSASRKEELAIETAMIRMARADDAIARAAAAMLRYDDLSTLAEELLRAAGQGKLQKPD